MFVGVIGTGVMGRNHARVYAAHRDVEGIILYDTMKGSADRVASEVEKTIETVYVAPTLQDALARCDAVSIVVPTAYHFPVVQEAIAANVPFLVEKPLAATVAEGKEIVESIPDHLVAGVGHVERFNPVVAEIAKIVETPCYVDIARLNPSSSRISDATVIEDLMIHDIDILLHTLFARHPQYTLAAVGDADVAAAVFKFGGVPVTLAASRRASKKTRRIYVEDEEFTVEGDLISQEVFVHRRPAAPPESRDTRYTEETVVSKVVVTRVEPLREEIAAFLTAVDTHRRFPIPLHEGLVNMEVCAQVRDAL